MNFLASSVALEIARGLGRGSACETPWLDVEIPENLTPSAVMRSPVGLVENVCQSMRGASAGTPLFLSTFVWILAFGILCFGPSLACAHDGPEHEIEELTQRIESEGESADLFLQRAIEYSVLNKTAEAIKDLQRALDYDASSPIIQEQLSRAYFAAGKTNEAFDTVNHAIKHTEEPSQLASLLTVRCELYRSRREYQKALDDVDRAIRKHPVNAEWYHTRSLLQQQLGVKKERIQGLEAGLQETGSGLLQADLVDALIDGGQAAAALAKIEPELKDARLRSSWLIRRARVRLALKQPDEAKADLEAALAELNERITPGSRDPLLLADRGQVYDLLGNPEEAKKNYDQAREKGMTEEWVRERVHAIIDAEQKKKENEKKDGKGK